MKVDVWIKYEESYLPPSCRKLHYRECEEHVALTLPEASTSDLRLAFEDSSYEGAGKIYSYNGELWRLATKHDRFCSSFFDKETEKETTLKMRRYTCSTTMTMRTPVCWRWNMEVRNEQKV